MSTPPLSSALIAKIKARTQAVRWFAMLKEVRTFSAYCCDINSNGIMGVAKQPVPIVNITPAVVCLGEEIDWDLTDSYAPGSTISAWEIDFGDGNSDTGASINAASGNHTYAAVGSYTVTITVEEGTGRNSELTREINVVDCSQPPDKYYYIATYGQGVWFLNRKDGSSTWVERNGGLEGDALYVNSMVMRPGQEHLSDGSHELWIATLGGVYRSKNSGKGWEQMSMPDPSNAEFADDAPATLGDLSWLKVCYHEADVYAIAAATVVTEDPVFIGEVQAATGAGPGAVCNCGFAGNIFFDGYDGIGTLSRATVTPGTPSIVGRTQIWTGILSTLSYNRYNQDEDAFIVSGYGAMIVSPPASGSVVLPEIDSTGAYVPNGDIVSPTDMISGNVFGANPPLYTWLRNIGSTGDYTTWDLGDSGGTNYHIAFCRYSSMISLVCGVDEAGNLFARTVLANTDDEILESLGYASSSQPCAHRGEAKCWLRKMGATSFALVFYDDAAGAWKITEITVTSGGASITIGGANALEGTLTPYDVAVIDSSSLAVIGRSGSADVYTTLSLSGSNSILVTVNTDLGAVEALAVGYSGGYALVSYLKDSDDSLYVASVEIP